MNYWTQRYKQNETGWDLGMVSPPIKAYIDQLNHTSYKILIPGAGNSYEAEYLYQQGFTDTYVCDISSIPLTNLSKRCPSIPKDHLLHEDFFSLGGHYDLIIEQTFFCAIDPSQRENYIQQMASLLRPSGKLVGLLFDRPFATNPPFGGSKQEYIDAFTPYFEDVSIQPCYNSVAPRSGSEVFILIKNPIR